MATYKSRELSNDELQELCAERLRAMNKLAADNNDLLRQRDALLLAWEKLPLGTRGALSDELPQWAADTIALAEGTVKT